MNEIKELRIRLGLTQGKLAQQLGVTLTTVQRWEWGKSKPSPMARQVIKELYGVEIK